MSCVSNIVTLDHVIILNRLNKIVKCSNNDDSVTIRASDSSDHVTLLFESPSKYNDRS